MLKLLKSNTCESIYTFNEEKFRLWAIVGGQLAIGLGDDYCDFYGTTRLNYCEAFDDKKHPDWDTKWKGPRISDIEGGEAKAIKVVKNLIDHRDFMLFRQKQIYTILSKSNEIYDDNEKNFILQSKRIHDPDNRTYLYCNLELGKRSPVITVFGNRYGGRCENEIIKFAPKHWCDLMKSINPIFDKYLMKGDLSYLSQEDFNGILEACKKFVKS